MRALLRGLAALLVLWAGAALAQPAERVSRPGEYRGHAPVLYTEVQRSSSYLRLRDGTRLAMDLYRPAANGRAVDTPHPVLWEHSLSRRSPPDVVAQSVTRRMHELVKYGYVVAYVERRGLGASFGARRAYNDRTEARDAYEVTEWLATQAWSTGKVGVFGCSNTGDAAMHAASFQPPHLRAVFAGCFSWNKFDGFMRGGIAAQWGYGPTRPIEEDLKNPPVDGDEDRTLLKQAVEDHRGSTPLAALWRGMPYRDSWSDLVASRFWLEGSVSTYRQQLQQGGAAFFIFGGWMDEFRREGLVAWANLQRNPARVLIGPWQHCLNPGYDLLADAHRFFDRYLKDVPNGIEQEPPVQVFEQAGSLAPTEGRWRSFDTWPPAAATNAVHRLALQPRANAAQDQPLLPPGGRAAAGADRVALTVQRAVPCPEAGSRTQPCSQAAQGLRFTGPALTAEMSVTGHPVARLWVASTHPEQNVFVTLEDLAPDGSATIVTEGRLKASLRATRRPPYDTLGLPWQRSLESDHAPLAGAEPVPLHFDLLPLAYVFKAGHRLRVVINGSDSRERQPAPPGHTLTLFSSAARPSHIEFPITRR